MRRSRANRPLAANTTTLPDTEPSAREVRKDPVGRFYPLCVRARISRTAIARTMGLPSDRSIIGTQESGSGRAHTHLVPPLNPTAEHSAKEVSALLREALSLLRRTDKLFVGAEAVDDPATTGLATEARRAIEQLVHHLTRLEQ